MKIDRKKIATIVKSEDAENRVMKIGSERNALVVEYLSSWTEIKDIKGSVTKSVGMIIDYYRESEADIGGLVIRCMGENLVTQVTCLLSKNDIERWINYEFSVDELGSRIE